VQYVFYITETAINIKNRRRTMEKKNKKQYPSSDWFENIRNRNYKEIKSSKFPSNCRLFIEAPKDLEKALKLEKMKKSRKKGK